MKKSLLLAGVVAAVGLASGFKAVTSPLNYAANPASDVTQHLYITGDGDFSEGAWNPATPDEFELVDGNYVITVNNLSMFKISTSYGDWDTFNEGALYCDYGNEPEVEASLMPGDMNITCPAQANWTITVAGDLSTIKLTTDDPIAVIPIEDEPLYIRGDMSEWAASDDWKLTRLGKDSEGAWVYSYVCGETGIEAGDNFKIADANWAKVNIGSNGEVINLDTVTEVFNGGNTTNIWLSEDVTGVIYLKVNYSNNNAEFYASNNQEAYCPFPYEGYEVPGTDPTPEVVGTPIEKIEDICGKYTISENWWWPFETDRPSDPTFTVSQIEDNLIAISCSWFDYDFDYSFGVEVAPIKASVDLAKGTITINTSDNKNLAFLEEYDEDVYLELMDFNIGNVEQVTVPVFDSKKLDFNRVALLWRISQGYFYGVGTFYLTKEEQDPPKPTYGLHMFINGEEVANGSRINITSFYEDEDGYSYMVDPKLEVMADEAGAFECKVTLVEGESVPEFDWDYGAQVYALWCAFDGQCVPLSVGKSATKAYTLTANKAENMRLEISGAYGDLQNPEELSIKAECTLNFTFGGKDYILTLYVDKQAQVVNEKHLYITGDGDFTEGAWNPATPDKFEFVDGNYVITVNNLSMFKISTSYGDWDTFNEGALYCDYGNEPGVEAPLMPGDMNITCPAQANWTITVAGDLSTIKLTTDDPIVVTPIEDEPLYIRGDVSEWAASDDWKLTRLGKDSEGAWVYSYVCGETGIEAGEVFKIADANWAKVNIGSNGVVTDLDTVTEVFNGGNTTNIWLSEDVTGVIYLKVNYSDNNAAFYASNDKEAPCPFDYEGRPEVAPVKVNISVSDGTAFGYKATFGTESMFTVSLADKYWKLTSYTLNGTEYELPEVTSSYDCEFTVLSMNNYVFTAEYDGTLEVVETSGVVELENKIKISVSDDTVEITGLEPGTSVAVYTLGGQTIMSREVTEEVLSIRLDKGQTYVVRAGEAAVKVIL